MSHKNIGDSFDSFLQEENILDHTEDVATKRVVAYQLQEEMKKLKISKKELAGRMNTSRSSVRRLLDPENESLTIKTLKKAAVTLGKRVEIRLV
jgi:predicted XRE-type DNA-binding protein